MVDSASRPEPIPADLEEQVFQLFFATQEAGREAAIADLADRHAGYRDAIHALAMKLQQGAGVFSELGQADAALPETIGPYKILDRLGEGGFGVVYLAEQEAPIRRRVAIKCLLPGMDSRRVLARFEAERQALAMMSHPNIARVLDARGDTGGRPYFVMEYVPGISITSYCDEHRLTTRQRLHLFIQVCDAVQHAHQKGVIHRDLKPSNVLVMEEGGKPVPKIIDFGVAKAIYQPLTMKTLFTEVGRMVGTPEYMSPEQTSPTPLDVDTRTDIYSLGVLLYEILTGSLPFDSEELRKQGLNEIHRVIREVDPPRPSQRVTTAGADSGELAIRHGTQPTTLVDELRGDLDWIVLRAIAKERARRYDTAQELAADIQRHLRHQPVLARPPQMSYLFAKFLRRHRTQVAAGVTVFVSLVAGLVFSTKFYLEARTNLANYDRLADVVLLEELVRGAEEDLWPEHPDKVQAMEAWLRRARPLMGRLQQHEATLDSLLEFEHRQGGGGKPVFEDGSVQFLHDTLAKLIGDLKAFGTTVQSVGDRMKWSSTIYRKSIEDPQARWAECRADIRKDKRFKGLDLKPQLGLVPIDRNPKTRLWEFAHLRTGSVAGRQAADGCIHMHEKNGLVFVLLPGGRFWMGAQAQDPKGHNYTELASPLEGPVHEVHLGPFFLSKYEMTQAQWLRVTGTNPSRFRPGDNRPAYRSISLTNPVESIDHQTAARTLERIGLTLPTEVQWEYACRGGTETAWYTGDTVESLKGHANIMDAGSAEYFHSSQSFEPGFEDGNAAHAAVGYYKPNAFGLWDMHGNVSEWTKDWFKFYENPTDPVTGLRLGEQGKRDLIVIRSGNFGQLANLARSAFRGGNKPENGSWACGVRPARTIDP